MDWECESQADLEPDDIAECLRYAALAVQERELLAHSGATQPWVLLLRRQGQRRAVEVAALIVASLADVAVPSPPYPPHPRRSVRVSRLGQILGPTVLDLDAEQHDAVVGHELSEDDCRCTGGRSITMKSVLDGSPFSPRSPVRRLVAEVAVESSGIHLPAET